MKGEAFTVDIPPTIYFKLSTHLFHTFDKRQPGEVATQAIRTWLAAERGKASGRGYQWKSLFLPDSTELRMHYRGDYYYAKVEGDRLMYNYEPVSPREWTLLVTGTVRNAWRDIWIRRNAGECWLRASMWRSQNSVEALLPYAERRRHARRSTD
ncbi:hypothetical protein [Massilia sp. erpn]|uniref:hypothetical protein n=1 Tax=Massilia sp. erpn TaxID=2738142 RepID=UPI002107F51E|nr:hypothetical protein [Massilia sp. erpn]UTY57039.1 hypothetical protein HPQ68_07450 [Massilia sp. erpn]